MEHESLYSAFHFTCAFISGVWMVCGILRLLCISPLHQPISLLSSSSLVYTVKVRIATSRWRGAFIHSYVTLRLHLEHFRWAPWCCKDADKNGRLLGRAAVMSRSWNPHPLWVRLKELGFSSCGRKARNTLVTALKCIYRYDKVF